ncbi:hypothetical protein N9C83_05325 [Opitutales bacterium]|jgi:hypothetical protein|nr:hypothetical protein [Opitutales bacterium]
MLVTAELLAGGGLYSFIQFDKKGTTRPNKEPWNLGINSLYLDWIYHEEQLSEKIMHLGMESRIPNTPGLRASTRCSTKHQYPTDFAASNCRIIRFFFGDCRRLQPN